jgi:hypothetical protein
LAGFGDIVPRFVNYSSSSTETWLALVVQRALSSTCCQALGALSPSPLQRTTIQHGVLMTVAIVASKHWRQTRQAVQSAARLVAVLLVTEQQQQQQQCTAQHSRLLCHSPRPLHLSAIHRLLPQAPITPPQALLDTLMTAFGRAVARCSSTSMHPSPCAGSQTTNSTSTPAQAHASSAPTKPPALPQRSTAPAAAQHSQRWTATASPATWTPPLTTSTVNGWPKRPVTEDCMRT